MSLRVVLSAVSIALSMGACASPITGIVTSDERRIWVVRGDKGQDVYRCADGTATEAPPKPVCVRAVFVGAGGAD